MTDDLTATIAKAWRAVRSSGTNDVAAYMQTGDDLCDAYLRALAALASATERAESAEEAVAACNEAWRIERDAALAKLARVEENERVVEVIVTETPDAQVWDTDRFTARCDFPAVECESQDRDAAVNFVKGAVLSAFGMSKELPDEISVRFKVVDGRQEDADRPGA